MQISSISAFAACWLLLCFVSPLQSNPQKSYWRSSDLYYPAPYPLYPSRTVEVVPPQISELDVPHPFLLPPPPSTPRRPEYNYASDDFRGAWTPARYAYPAKDLPLEAKKPEMKHALKETKERSHSVYGSPVLHNGTETSAKKKGAELQELDDHDGEDSQREEEILRKMKILERVLSEEPGDKDIETNTIEDRIISETNLSEESKRVVRQVRKQRPGFFWTLARVTFETINDTRSAIKQISEIVNNSIAPDPTTPRSPIAGSQKVTTTQPTVTSDRSNTTSVNGTLSATTMGPTTTTEEPYVLTRSGLQTIIRRNLLGLIRLFNIEWKDAINESDVSVKQFQKDLGNQIGTFLQDNPNAY